METYFGFELNRSERALQAARLVSALNDDNLRWKLLSAIRMQKGTPITKDEADHAKVMHFVWILRDTFFHERDNSEKTKEWAGLRDRWCEIMDLPDWAQESVWWRHPDGAYKGDSEYVVHPCNREIGWTDMAIRRRASIFPILGLTKSHVDTLVNARKVMNTECDCFIQTPQRLIVVECKDKSEFLTEQEQRQQRLFLCLERLLKRPQPLVYVEIAGHPPETRPNQWWSWTMLPKPE